MGIPDMVSTTPLAEYVDMIYNRLAIEMAKHKHITDWFLVLSPPKLPADGVGYVEIHGRTQDKKLTYRASMHAIQRGAMVSTEVLEDVVDYHMAKFTEALVA